MSALPLRFVWKPQKLTNARWRLGLFALQRTRKGSEVVVNRQTEGLRRQLKISAVHISLRGLLVWAVSLAVIGYLSAAVVLYSNQRRQPHNRVAFSDIVFPWRWSELQRLRGATFLAQADDKLAAGDMSGALPLLRIGVAKLPSDWEHRHILAQFYTLMRAPAAAHKLVLEGFAHGYPDLERLRALQRIVAEGDSPELQERFLKLAREAHARAGAPAADLRQIDIWGVQLLLSQNRADEAVALAREAFAPDDANLRMALVRAALKRDDRAEAARLCAEWAAAAPDDPVMLFYVAAIHAETGDRAGLDAGVRRLRELNPLDWRVIGQGVQLYLLAGMEERAKALLEEGFLWFSSDAKALESWLPFIATRENEELLLRIEEVMTDHGFDTTDALLWRLHVQIQRREWARAADMAGLLSGRIDKLEPVQKSVFELSQALVNACIDGGGGTQQQLASLFRSPRYRMSSLRMVIEGLLAADRLETAREIATLGRGHFPESTELAELTARIDRRLAEAAAARPVAPAPAESGPSYDDAGALLAEVDRLAADKQGADALRLIATTRRQAPSWWVGGQEPVVRRELALLAETGDLSMLQLRVREYLRGEPARRATLLELAVRWHAADRTKAAQLAVREVLKLAPDDAAALKLQKTWEPTPASTPAPAPTATPAGAGGAGDVAPVS